MKTCPNYIIQKLHDGKWYAIFVSKEAAKIARYDFGFDEFCYGFKAYGRNLILRLT